MQLVRTDVQSTRLTFPHRLVLRFRYTLPRFRFDFVFNTHCFVFCATSFPTHVSYQGGYLSAWGCFLRFQHTFSDSIMFPLSSDGCQKKVAESSIDHSTYFGYWSREPPGPTGRPITDDFQPDLTAETAAIHPITSAVHARVALRTRTQSIDPISSHRPVQKRPHTLYWVVAHRPTTHSSHIYISITPFSKHAYSIDHVSDSSIHPPRARPRFLTWSSIVYMVDIVLAGKHIRVGSW